MSHEYKVGDRVISLCGPEMFAKATVCYAGESQLYNGVGIAYDEPIGTHNCGGHCKGGYGYWAFVSDLIPEPFKKASEREYLVLNQGGK